MNNFIFIICFHNVAQFIRECADSLIGQNYPNWRAIFVDDASTDDTINRIPYDPRFHIIRNSSRKTALYNINYVLSMAGLQPEDIVCLLDGDDKLTIPGACALLNNIYNRYQPLISYGQYISSQGDLGHCVPYDPSSFTDLRSGRYIASHLRTFRYLLYEQLVIQDPKLTCFRDSTGKWYTMAYDVALMTPLLEMAGLEHVYFNPYPLYYYRLHSNNDHMINVDLQQAVAKDISLKPVFKRVY